MSKKTKQVPAISTSDAVWAGGHLNCFQACLSAFP